MTLIPTHVLLIEILYLAEEVLGGNIVNIVRWPEGPRFYLTIKFV